MKSNVRVCRDGVKRNALVKRTDNEVRDFFFSQFKKLGENDCWNWEGYTNGAISVYGALWVDRKLMKAHRYSFEIHKGNIPEGKIVRHSCDNKLCVNPLHLLVGTQKDNIKDMYDRNRNVNKGAIGINNYHAIMNDSVVRKIIELKKSGISVLNISRAVGFKKTTVGSVLEGRTWRHVTGLSYPHTRSRKPLIIAIDPPQIDGHQNRNCCDSINEK